MVKTSVSRSAMESQTHHGVNVRLSSTFCATFRQCRTRLSVSGSPPYDMTQVVARMTPLPRRIQYRCERTSVRSQNGGLR
jgi:hypothetical protein